MLELSAYLHTLQLVLAYYYTGFRLSDVCLPNLVTVLCFAFPFITINA